MAPHRGQGAFEYILMLSGVLLVVITITYMMQGSVAQADSTLDAQMKAAGVALDPSYYLPGAKPQFMPNSPPDGTWGTAQPNISALITVKDAQLYELKYNWNGANYSIYDQSLVLALNFDGSDMAGDSATKAVDVSASGNNGTIAGNTALLLHMDENAGSTAYDEGPYRNNGTCYGMGTSCNWTSGRSGTGIYFDAVDDYINAGNAASLDITTAITIEAWVKVAAFGTNQYRGIVGKTSDAIVDGCGYGYGLSSGWDAGNYFGFFIHFEGRTDCGRWVASGTVSTNTWYHLVGTYDSTTGMMKFYRNGALDGSRSETAGTKIRSAPSRPVVFGVNPLVSGWRFNGVIDEVGIYNRAISAAEVAGRYGAGKAKHANWDPNGKFGGAMKFDGINNQVTIPDSASLNASSAITVAAWTRKEQMPCTTNPGPPITYPGCHDQPVVIKGDSTYTDDATAVSLTWGWGDDFYFRLRSNDGTNMAVGVPGGIASSTNWHYVAGNFNGTTLSVYVDGVKKSTASYPGKTVKYTNRPVYIGKIPNGYTYQGGIDEVRIWNRALSDDEVAMQYRSSLNKYTANAWFFENRNDNLATGTTYNYTLYANGGYRKDSSSETRTVKVCPILLVPC